MNFTNRVKTCSLANKFVIIQYPALYFTEIFPNIFLTLLKYLDERNFDHKYICILVAVYERKCY